MRKIISIVGARPQFIKLAPLALYLNNTNLTHKIIHTGQHFDDAMSRFFFEDLNIPAPNYHLSINGSSHGQQTAHMLSSIENVLTEEKPAGVVVFGDTNSTLAGALAATKLQIPVIHIEAGLRSYNRSMPEEINRIITDHCSDLLLAPTLQAISNLTKEGLGEKSELCGDIMVDSIGLAIHSLQKDSESEVSVATPYYLLTLHRPYNVDDPIKLSLILKKVSGINQKIVFPIHPRTKKIISSNNIEVPKQIEILDPVGYLEFISLQKNSIAIITDSGGIQKEAYVLRKPCITLRSETEWIETVEVGWNKLIDIEKEEDVNSGILNFSPPDNHPDLFGKNVTEKIFNAISRLLGVL